MSVGNTVPRGVLVDGPITNIGAFLDTCPETSTEGAELNVWNELYFIEKHLPRNKYTAPTGVVIKTAGLKLINMFSGGSAIYKDYVKDMFIIILSMPNPSDHTKLMFDEFITGDTGEAVRTSATETSVTTFLDPETTNYNVVNTFPQSTVEVNTLAEEITHTATNQVSAEPIMMLNETDITTFWRDLFTKFGSLGSQSDWTEEHHLAIAMLGIICLHSMKLMSRKASATQKSMHMRMTKHFLDMYKPVGGPYNLVPIHLRTLMSMEMLFSSGSNDVLQILSILIAKVIVENASTSPNAIIKGILYGSCLTHIGLFGMAPVKHVEQASSVLGMGPSSFMKMICTSKTKDSLLNVCKILKLSTIPAGEVNIMGTSYNLQTQFSWRFCRLYNNSHFQRFKTKTNTNLIIRCAAFLSVTPKGTEISKMAILDSPMNRALFERERAIADRYVREQVIKEDIALTPESQVIFAPIVQDVPISDPFND